MTLKIPIYPDRIRSVPKQFNWVDHRLIRDHHIERLSHEACTLYLFLVTVADCQGLSYYSDSSICERLSMKEPTLCAARACLRKAELIAWKKPLYQLLPLVDLMSVSKKNCEDRVRKETYGVNAPFTILQFYPNYFESEWGVDPYKLHIQTKNRHITQDIRNIALHNSQCQAFHYSSLTNPGLTHNDRVILSARLKLVKTKW